jgi:hypothetical protein
MDSLAEEIAEGILRVRKVYLREPGLSGFAAQRFNNIHIAT